MQTMEYHLPQNYMPHKGQRPFHDDRYVVPYRGLLGGTASGKTIAGMWEDVRWCLGNDGIVGYVFEPVYRLIDRIVIPTLNHLLGVIPFWNHPAVEQFHRGRMCISWNNGSTLWLGSLDEPEQAEGPNVDFIHVDEARLVKPDEKWRTAWHVVLRRIRGSGGGHPIGAWVTTTPNLPGSSLWRFFEGPDRNPNAKIYRMHIDDNIDNLPPGFIEDIKREHFGSLYKRFVEGFFAGEETATFDFDYVVHVQGFKKPKYGDIVYGVDFGWSEETAILAIMFDNDRRAYVLDETYEKRLSDAEIGDKCFQMQGKWGKGTFWCDPAAPDTIDYLKREGLKAKPGNRRKDEGIREIGGRLKDAGDGRRRLYVSDTCRNLIDELQVYNEEQKGHDHAVDALRYCLLGGKRKREAAWGLGPKRRW